MGDENSTQTNQTTQTQTRPEDLPVPRARFAEVVAERNAAQEESKRWQERAATADTLAKQLEALKADFTKARDTWDGQRAYLQAGITDDEGIEIADWHYSRLPEKDRPPRGDWLKALQAEPDKAPRSLRPWLEQPVSDTEADEVDDEPEPPRRERPPRTQRSADPAGAGAGAKKPTVDQVRTARERAVRSGDWSEWERLTGTAPLRPPASGDNGHSGARRR